MKSKRIYDALWNDGYLCELIEENEEFRLLGKIMTFGSIRELEKYYKGKIKKLTLKEEVSNESDKKR